MVEYQELEKEDEVTGVVENGYFEVNKLD